MQLVPYSHSNRGNQRAMPLARDAKPKRAMFNSYTGAPRNGKDYIYGYAHISAARKLKDLPENEFKANPMGWALPGGEWTNNNARVMEAAKEIDRLIKAAGGLPSWVGKKGVAA